MPIALNRPAPTGPPGRTPLAEFAFTEADFVLVCQLLHRHAGIRLQAGKQAMVYSRLARRLRETGHRSVADYLASLQGEADVVGSVQWQAFINCLTTNLTAFFREAHHFEALAADLRARSERPLRIWCAASSTGEEAYSIAMTVAETLGPDAAVQILATDIDTAVLASARRGIYPLPPDGLSAARMHRHFLRGKGANAGLIRVRPELARLIAFRPFNLMDSPGSLGASFDMVFCRNVMIYFDQATQHRVLQQLHRALSPLGLLYVGHAESFSDAGALFRLRGKTIYQRI